MVMLFLHKCILYKEDEDLVIHDVVRVKNAFRFSIEDEDYGKTIIDILVKYGKYTKEDLLKDLSNILIFTKQVLGRDFDIEDYEMYIKLDNYYRRSVFNEI